MFGTARLGLFGYRGITKHHVTTERRYHRKGCTMPRHFWIPQEEEKKKSAELMCPLAEVPLQFSSQATKRVMEHYKFGFIHLLCLIRHFEVQQFKEPLGKTGRTAPPSHVEGFQRAVQSESKISLLNNKKRPYEVCLGGLVAELSHLFLLVFNSKEETA